MAFQLSYKEVEAQRLLKMKLVNAALKDLRTIWDAIPDKTDGALVRMILEDSIGDLITAYGQPIAVVAAQEFERLRDANKVAGRFTALSAKTPEVSRINAHIGAAIGPIFQTDTNPEAAFKQVQGLVSRMTLESGRRTIDENVTRGGSRALGYARVPGRSDSCQFCRMLASRGPVYGAKSAKYGKDGHKYHDNCWCEPVPVFDKDTEIEGYDPDQILEDWKNEEAEKASRAADRIFKKAAEKASKA